MIYPPNAVDALHSLGFTDVSGVIPSNEEEYANLRIHSDDESPTWKEVNKKLDELTTNWTAQEYARNRATEYPSQGDQMDMIYKDNKNSTTTHADAVEAVKTKWPKDNSGPK